MKNRLLNEYKNSPNLHKLITSLLELPTDELLEILNSIKGRLSIDESEGFQLDQIGVIVGQNRPLDFTDEEYRTLLRSRIFLNVAGATVREIERYSELVLGVPAQVLVGFTYVDLTFFRALTEVEKVIVTETLTAAAGIRIRFLAFSEGANPFGFIGNINNTGFTRLPTGSETEAPYIGDGFVGLL